MESYNVYIIVYLFFLIIVNAIHSMVGPFISYLFLMVRLRLPYTVMGMIPRFTVILTHVDTVKYRTICIVTVIAVCYCVRLCTFTAFIAVF